jgi:hypothetical protein
VVVYVVLIQISIQYGTFSLVVNMVANQDQGTWVGQTLTFITGIGKHLADTDPTKLPTGVKYMYIGEMFAMLAMPTGKTSFCITLLRLTTKKWHQALIWFIIVTINLFMWLLGFLTMLQCTPVHKLWDVEQPGHCWDNHYINAWAITVGGKCLLLMTLRR